MRATETCACGASTTLDVEAPLNPELAGEVVERLLATWRRSHVHLGKVGPCGKTAPNPALGLIGEPWHPPCELAAGHTGQHQHTLMDGARMAWT